MFCRLRKKKKGRGGGGGTPLNLFSFFFVRRKRKERGGGKAASLIAAAGVKRGLYLEGEEKGGRKGGGVKRTSKSLVFCDWGRPEPRGKKNPLMSPYQRVWSPAALFSQGKEKREKRFTILLYSFGSFAKGELHQLPLSCFFTLLGAAGLRERGGKGGDHVIPLYFLNPAAGRSGKKGRHP